MKKEIESNRNLSVSPSPSLSCPKMQLNAQTDSLLLLLLLAYVMLSVRSARLEVLASLVSRVADEPHSMSKRNFASYNGTNSRYCCCCWYCCRGVRVCEFFWLPFRCCCILDHFGRQTNGFL